MENLSKEAILAGNALRISLMTFLAIFGIASSNPVSDGKVIGQDAAAGGSVANGSAVDLTGHAETSHRGAAVFAGNTVVNVSAGQNLDTVVANSPGSKVTFVLSAGTYVTNGLLPVGNSIQFIGRNPDRNTDNTIIKLARTSANHEVFKDSSGDYTPIDRFEIWNLTIDTDFQDRTDHAAVAAVYAVGSNILIGNCHILNYGVSKKGVECFPVYLDVQNPTANYQSQHVHIEHCKFTPASARNADGISCIMLPAQRQSGQSYVDAAVIDTTFDGQTDAGIIYYHCVTGGNQISGCTATLNAPKGFGAFWYEEPGSFLNSGQSSDDSSSDILIQGNTVTLGPNFRFLNLFWNPQPGAGDCRLGALTLDGNHVSVAPDGTSDFFFINGSGFPTNAVRSITLTNNVVTGNLRNFYYSASGQNPKLIRSGNKLNGTPLD